jgi:hypothetical protein
MTVGAAFGYKLPNSGPARGDGVVNKGMRGEEDSASVRQAMPNDRTPNTDPRLLVVAVVLAGWPATVQVVGGEFAPQRLERISQPSRIPADRPILPVPIELGFEER